MPKTPEVFFQELEQSSLHYRSSLFLISEVKRWNIWNRRYIKRFVRFYRHVGEGNYVYRSIVLFHQPVSALQLRLCLLFVEGIALYRFAQILFIGSYQVGDIETVPKQAIVGAGFFSRIPTGTGRGILPQVYPYIEHVIPQTLKNLGFYFRPPKRDKVRIKDQFYKQVSLLRGRLRYRMRRHSRVRFVRSDLIVLYEISWLNSFLRKEAKRLRIPTLAFVDPSSEAFEVTYALHCNCSTDAIRFVLTRLLFTAIERGHVRLRADEIKKFKFNNDLVLKNLVRVALHRARELSLICRTLRRQYYHHLWVKFTRHQMSLRSFHFRLHHFLLVCLKLSGEVAKSRYRYVLNSLQRHWKAARYRHRPLYLTFKSPRRALWEVRFGSVSHKFGVSVVGPNWFRPKRKPQQWVKRVIWNPFSPPTWRFRRKTIRQNSQYLFKRVSQMKSILDTRRLARRFRRVIRIRRTPFYRYVKFGRKSGKLVRRWVYLYNSAFREYFIWHRIMNQYQLKLHQRKIKLGRRGYRSVVFTVLNALPVTLPLIHLFRNYMIARTRRAAFRSFWSAIAGAGRRWVRAVPRLMTKFLLYPQKRSMIYYSSYGLAVSRWSASAKFNFIPPFCYLFRPSIHIIRRECAQKFIEDLLFKFFTFMPGLAGVININLFVIRRSLSIRFKRQTKRIQRLMSTPGSLVRVSKFRVNLRNTRSVMRQVSYSLSKSKSTLACQIPQAQAVLFIQVLRQLSNIRRRLKRLS